MVNAVILSGPLTTSNKSSAYLPLFYTFGEEIEISPINEFVEESLELLYGIRGKFRLICHLSREEFEEKLVVAGGDGVCDLETQVIFGLVGRRGAGTESAAVIGRGSTEGITTRCLEG